MIAHGEKQTYSTVKGEDSFDSAFSRIPTMYVPCGNVSYTSETLLKFIE